MKFAPLLAVLALLSGCIGVSETGVADAGTIQGPLSVTELDGKYRTASGVQKIQGLEIGMVVVTEDGSGRSRNAYVVPYQAIPEGTWVRLAAVERRINRNVEVTDFFVRS